MSRGYDRDRPARLYVGNLPEDVREREIEDLFSKYGRIRDVDLKTGRTSNGTAFAFVEFDSVREAEDAIDGRDGCRFGNLRLRVEFSGERGAKRPGFRGGPPKRTDYRVVISGLPPSASWQDLKDHMRQAGPVGYADAKNGEGIVEYETEDDMLYAIKKLDRSEFRNPFTHSVIRVRAESEKYNDRDHSRSRSRERSHRRLSPSQGSRGSHGEERRSSERGSRGRSGSPLRDSSDKSPSTHLSREPEENGTDSISDPNNHDN